MFVNGLGARNSNGSENGGCVSRAGKALSLSNGIGHGAIKGVAHREGKILESSRVGEGSTDDRIHHSEANGSGDVLVQKTGNQKARLPGLLFEEQEREGATTSRIEQKTEILVGLNKREREIDRNNRGRGEIKGELVRRICGRIEFAKRERATENNNSRFLCSCIEFHPPANGPLAC